MQRLVKMIPVKVRDDVDDHQPERVSSEKNPTLLQLATRSSHEGLNTCAVFVGKELLPLLALSCDVRHHDAENTLPHSRKPNP